MVRYLLRTMCRSCSGGDRDVTMVSAFCGCGTERLLKSDQAGPDPNGSRWYSHPRTTGHATVTGSSLGSASTLLSWVGHVLVQSEGNCTAREDKYGVVERALEKGSRPSKGYLFLR